MIFLTLLTFFFWHTIAMLLFLQAAFLKYAPEIFETFQNVLQFKEP